MFQLCQIVEGDFLGVVGMDVLEHTGQEFLPELALILIPEDLGEQHLDAVFQQIRLRLLPFGLVVEGEKELAHAVLPVMELNRGLQLQLRDVHPEADDLPQLLCRGLLLMLPSGRIDHSVKKRDRHLCAGDLQLALAVHKVHEFNIGVTVAAEIPERVRLVEPLAESQLRLALMDHPVIFV